MPDNARRAVDFGIAVNNPGIVTSLARLQTAVVWFQLFYFGTPLKAGIKCNDAIINFNVDSCKQF